MFCLMEGNHLMLINYVIFFHVWPSEISLMLQLWILLNVLSSYHSYAPLVSRKKNQCDMFSVVNPKWVDRMLQWKHFLGERRSLITLAVFCYDMKMFSVVFCSTVQRWLTTAPGAPTTHWYQLRCILSQPLYVMPGQEITGRLHMIAHNAQSYTIHLTMSS